MRNWEEKSDKDYLMKNIQNLMRKFGRKTKRSQNLNIVDEKKPSNLNQNRKKKTRDDTKKDWLG